MPGSDLVDARLLAAVTAGLLGVLTLVRLAARGRAAAFFATTSERLMYWWCLGIFSALSLRFGLVPVVVGIGLASFLLLKEYFTVIPSRKADRAAIMVSYLSIPFTLYFVYSGWYNMFVLTIPIYAFLLFPVLLAIDPDRSGMVLSLGKISLGVMFLVYCPAHLGYLYVLNPHWFVSVILLAELSDQAQIFLSKLGTSSVLPMVEETGVRKNWLGAGLSIPVMMLAALTLGRFNGWSWGHCAAIGVLMPAFSLMGDLVMFSIRSDLGIVGPRALVPGRGLILDRMRTTCYAAPLMFHYLRYFLT